MSFSLLKMPLSSNEAGAYLTQNLPLATLPQHSWDHRPALEEGSPCVYESEVGPDDHKPRNVGLRDGTYPEPVSPPSACLPSRLPALAGTSHQWGTDTTDLGLLSLWDTFPRFTLTL